MPRARTSTPEEVAAAVAEHGSINKAAEALGIGRVTAQRYMKMVDPAVRVGMERLGTGLVPKTAWIKVKETEDSPGYSFMVRPDEQEAVERVREMMEGIPAAEPQKAPPWACESLLSVYLLADVHVGLLAWAQEAGEDFDTRIATDRMTNWMARAVDAAPNSDTGILLALGDTLHANDVTGMTPHSRHVLDVDGRHFRTVDLTITALCASIDLMLHKHRRVIVRILPGNHDRDSYLALMFAVAERYRLETRVEVQKVPGEHFVHQHGKVLIAAHHGDKAKPPQLVLWLADRHPEMWGATRHRHLFTGHLHHYRAQDIGGVQHEQLRAVAEKDAWAAGMSFTSRAQLQVVTFDAERGEVQRSKVGA